MQKVDFKKYEKFQVAGGSAIIFQMGFKAHKFLVEEFLVKNNILDYEPDKWYPLVKNLEIEYQVLEELGENLMFEIGKSAADYIHLPQDQDTIEKVLASLNYAYHTFHGLDNQPLLNPNTGEMTKGIGDYKYTLLGNNTAKIVCDSPYPCSFDRGLITGLVRKFSPLATVEYEEGVNHRKDGAESSSYIINW